MLQQKGNCMMCLCLFDWKSDIRWMTMNQNDFLPGRPTFFPSASYQCNDFTWTDKGCRVWYSLPPVLYFLSVNILDPSSLCLSQLYHRDSSVCVVSDLWPGPGKPSFWTALTLTYIWLFFPLKCRALLSLRSLCSPTPHPSIPTLGVNQGMWWSKCPLLLAEWTFCPHPLNVLTKGHPVSPLLSPSRGRRGVVT